MTRGSGLIGVRAAIDRAYKPQQSCKDSFRYRLEGQNGRYRFVSVRFVGAEGCRSDELEEVAAMLRGKWLDEVDVEALSRMACRGGRSCGCPQEVVKMVVEIKQMLLSGEVEPDPDTEVRSATR